MPASTPTDLATYRTAIKERVRDKGGKLADPDEYDSALLEALKEYSRYREREVVVEYTGTGTRYIPQAIATQWKDGFSRLLAVDTTALADVSSAPDPDADPTWLEITKDVSERLIGTARYWFIPLYTPTSQNLWRFHYTSYQTIDKLDGATATTVPVHDAEKLANLAASFACMKLAAFYLDTVDNNKWNADVVNYRTRSDAYNSMAVKYRALFDVAMGIAESEPVACSQGDIDMRFQWARPFLTHTFRR